MRVLQSGWWTSGPVVRQLEQEFATRIGVRHAVAVSSGTAALHLAHLALGLKPGDEVLIPSLNFVAGANSILHGGGTPKFVDVCSPDTPLVTAATLARRLAPGIRGICVMHYGGYPCPMDDIMDFARAHRLWVVEDASHAPGAAWKGSCCGTWGDVGCFSFFGNKNITCGEGGMVVTQRDDIADSLRSLRSHGMDLLTWDRYHGHRFSYDVKDKGFNFRMDDIRAAILRAQLRALERINNLRKERVAWYCDLLKADSRWSIPLTLHKGDSAYHLMVLVLSQGIDRSRLITGMRGRGIQTSIHYPPIHQFTYYRKLPLDRSDLEVTETLGRQLLTLPLYPDMTREQVELVCRSLVEVAGE